MCGLIGVSLYVGCTLAGLVSGHCDREPIKTTRIKGGSKWVESPKEVLVFSDIGDLGPERGLF